MKRRADSIRTQNVQRPVFCRQPARIILFDAQSFEDNNAIFNWCDAFDNVMSVACSVNGPNRIPLVGIIYIDSYPEVLFPLQLLRGNFSRFDLALNEIRRAASSHKQSTRSFSVIGEAIKESLSMFGRQAHGLLQTAGCWSQLELTLITGQEVSKLLNEVRSLVRTLNLEGLKRIQIVSTSTDILFPRELSPSTLSQKSSESGDMDAVEDSNFELVDYITLENQILCFETYLKGWLHEVTTEQEHIHIILPGDDQQTQLTLKCDLQERIINPNSTQFASCFILNMEGNCLKPPTHTNTNFRAATHHFQISKLKVIFRLPSKAVCESLLYGMPLVAKATSCWKIDWDELEDNQQHFQALCQLLAEKDEVLIAQLNLIEPKEDRTFRYNIDVSKPNGVFLLLPSQKGSLLIKPIAIRELVLPVKPTSCDQATESYVRNVTGSIDMIERLDYYNPLLTKSNLYVSLITDLTKNVPGSLAGFKPTQDKPPVGRTRNAKSSSSFTTAASLMQSKTREPLHSKPETVLYCKPNVEFPFEL